MNIKCALAHALCVSKSIKKYGWIPGGGITGLETKFFSIKL